MVNFTGIKNAGAMYIVIPNIRQTTNIMSMQLTNDETGNDLDEFKNTIKKTGYPQKYTSPYEGTVNICVTTNYPEEEYLSPANKFFVNGAPLEVNDNNLPVFSYLCRLSEKIKDKKPEELPVNTEYADTPDFLNGTLIACYMKQILANNPNANIKPVLSGIYSPPVAKAGAEAILKSVNDTMGDYFA